MPATIDEITNTIIEKLETGTMPWERPWSVRTQMPVRHCGTPYKGFNVLWLSMMATQHGYASPIWMTYKQAQTLNAQVRKGQKGTLSYFYKPVFAEDNADDPNTPDHITSWILKTYRVFNADQIDGLPDSFFPTLPDISETERTKTIDAFFKHLPPVKHGGSQACYDTHADQIHMPARASFKDDDLYASTLAHEFAHFTGHEKRLNRTFGKRFGDEAYAFEELVACLGQALLGGELGLPTSHLDNHAAYIKAWIKVLKRDTTALLSAARHAEDAVGYLFDLAKVERPSRAAVQQPDNTNLQVAA